MFIGDVGQDLTEELNLGVAGANYGWPACEGACGTGGMTNPIFTYAHSGRDAAITEGSYTVAPSSLPLTRVCTSTEISPRTGFGISL